MIAVWFANTLTTYSSTLGAPCQYVVFLPRITWSPLRHSLKVNGPLNTVGFVFSGALSMSSGFDVAVTYLPKTWVGSTYPMSWMIAGHETFAILTVHFFGLAVSSVTPVMVVALASLKSLKPWMSWKLDFRTVLADLPTAKRPVSQSCATIGLPSDQFVFAFSSKVYVSPSLEML